MLTEGMMRDILFTIASAGPQPIPLHLHVGGWETFIDAETSVTVQFARAQGQVVARILEPHDDQVDATLVVGSGVPDLLATLRQATVGVGTETSS
jgi:hypothetical protein